MVFDRYLRWRLLPCVVHLAAACTAHVDRSGGPGDAGGNNGDAPGAQPPADAPRDVPADLAPVDTAPPPVDLVCGKQNPGNAGCGFYAAEPYLAVGHWCYAMFVVNPGSQPAKLALQRGTRSYAMAQVARLPRGAGLNLTYAPYDEAAGLPPGDVAIIFVAGQADAKPRQVHDPVMMMELDTPACPFGTQPAEPQTTQVDGSALGTAFHLTSDRPVVAYDIDPYGGAFSYVTSASLLLPAESWGQSYIAATPYHAPLTVATNDDDPLVASYPMFLTITATSDGTDVAVRPTSSITGGPGVVATPAGQTLRLRLNAGQYAQLVGPAVPIPATSAGFSGSIVTANKPVALVGGASCLNVPADSAACDGAHQQIPPFSAWGHQYAAVCYRGRISAVDEPVPWLLVGAVDGTVLTYAPKAPAPYASAPAPAPTKLAAGEAVQFWTAEPFVVGSQDAAHPFYLAGHMTGGAFLAAQRSAAELTAGDPEFVNVVPLEQFMNQYTFFTDPTYSETNLVVVRRPGSDGRLADVTLGCSGKPLDGWMPLGEVQYTRVDLSTGDYKPVIPGCGNGVHTITSTAPFSVTVWGWGTKASGGLGVGTVSYAYPAGAALGAVTTAPPPVIP